MEITKPVNLIFICFTKLQMWTITFSVKICDKPFLFCNWKFGSGCRSATSQPWALHNHLKKNLLLLLWKCYGAKTDWKWQNWVELKHTVNTCFISYTDRDMAARHRARGSSIQIIKVNAIPAKKCRRPYIKQFHVSLCCIWKSYHFKVHFSAKDTPFVCIEDLRKMFCNVVPCKIFDDKKMQNNYIFEYHYE